MGEAMAYIFLLLTAVCCIGAVAALVTPKAAFFLKRKTRFRGAGAWLGFALLFFIGCAFTIPKEYAQEVKHANSVDKTLETAANPQKSSQQSNESSAVAKDANSNNIESVPLKYVQTEIDDISIPKRKRAQVFIALADPNDQVSSHSIAATCMAAAKYYADEYGYQALTIFITDIPGRKSWEGSRLAQCSYSPDKKGWSGKQNWLWEGVQVSDRSTTTEERQIKQLWGKLRDKYQKNGSTDEEALKAAIAKQIPSIPSNKIGLYYLVLQDYPEKNLLNIKPDGPSSILNQSSGDNTELTEQELRKQVIQLLKELDNFKNSRIFAECMYGCGSDNPAHTWNERRQALQEKITPQTQAPLALKTAASYLYQLGKAYHEKNKADIKFFRQEIEEGLK